MKGSKKKKLLEDSGKELVEDSPKELLENSQKENLENFQKEFLEGTQRKCSIFKGTFLERISEVSSEVNSWEIH